MEEKQLNKNIPSGDIKDFAMYILNITNRVAIKKGVKMMKKEEAEELVNDLWKKYKYDVDVPILTK